MPDVVVIGGGVVGAACALALARSGASVTLLERSELAAGASGRNHGILFRPADPPLVPHFDASLSLYRELAGSSDLPFLHDEEPLGFLVVFDDQESRTSGKAEADLAEAVGVRVEAVDHAGLRRLEPNLSEHVEGGWLIHDGVRVDPALLTVAMAREARARGAEIHTGVNARAVLVSRGRVRGVATDVETIATDAAVVAAGPWTPVLTTRLGLRVPVHGARGWIAHLGPSPGLVHRIVEYGGWHLPPGLVHPAQPLVSDLASGAVIGDANVLLHPAPGDSYLLGGSRIASLREDAEAPEIVAQLAQKASSLIPAVASVPVMRTWSGVRPMSPDGRPLVGRLPVEGLWLATGHGSQGVILAGGTGALLADLIFGRTPKLPHDDLDPSRFAASQSK